MSKIDHHAAYELAKGLLLKAGFELHHVSMQTESSYYSHPSRKNALIRLSAHKAKKSPIGLNGTVSRVSFTPGEGRVGQLTQSVVRDRVTWAIGRYFLEDPKPSRYIGKKGTWENANHKEQPLTRIGQSNQAPEISQKKAYSS